jgi:hypothetical protein
MVVIDGSIHMAHFRIVEDNRGDRQR